MREWIDKAENFYKLKCLDHVLHIPNRNLHQRVTFSSAEIGRKKARGSHIMMWYHYMKSLAVDQRHVGRYRLPGYRIWLTWLRTAHNDACIFALYHPFNLQLHDPFTHTFLLCLVELYSQCSVFPIMITTTLYLSLL